MKALLLFVNTVVYIYVIFVITFLGGAMWNGILIPDQCTPISISTACEIYGRSALWGGAFVEATIFSLAAFLLNRLLLRSFLQTTFVAKLILGVELVVAFVLYTFIGVTTH